MTKNKYEFIRELLEDKRINQNQRERVLKLSAKEFDYEGSLEQRIKKIEQYLAASEANNQKEENLKHLRKGLESENKLATGIVSVVKPKKWEPIKLPFPKEVPSDVIDEINVIHDLEMNQIMNLFGKQVESHKPEIEKIQYENVRSTNSNKQSKYIPPYKLYEFLFEYNQNPVLKYTCHDVDAQALCDINIRCNSETYDFSKHLKIIVEEFDNHCKQYFAPYNTLPLIRGYLTGKKNDGSLLKAGWSTDQIRENWGSPNLFQWTIQNPGIPPNWNEDLAEEQNIQLFAVQPQVKTFLSFEPIQNFTQLTLHFKNLFHLTHGRSSLMTILKRMNEFKMWNEKVEIEFDENRFRDNLEHFTNVNKITETYNHLLDSIIKKHEGDEKPKIKLSFYEDSAEYCVYLSIHHTNGVYKKTIQNTLERDGERFQHLIKNQINGLCNLILRADFGGNEYAKINLWNGKKRSHTLLPSFQGVEFLLEFPKRKPI